MKILHMLKEEPDESVKKIIDMQSHSTEVKTVELYEGNINYEKLVDLIFQYDRVICW